MRRVNPHYSILEIETIVVNCQATYTEDKFLELKDGFQWEKSDFQVSYNKRNQLEKDLTDSLRDSDDIKFKKTIADIYKWGFGKQLNKDWINNDKFWELLKELLTGLYKLDCILNIRNTEIPSLIKKMLDIKDVGLATLSKWICFVNQSKFAIYDSRVSIALREIKVDEIHRAFPIMARRKLKNKIAWKQDSIFNNVANNDSSSRVANMYVDYLIFLNKLIDKCTLIEKAADIEIALFMAGDVWSSKEQNANLKILRRGMWKNKNNFI